MSLNTKTAIASVNLGLNAAYDVANTGFIDIYNGVQPATPDVALSGQTLLATLTLGATAFAPAAGGSKIANAIGAGTGLAASAPTWFRCTRADHTTPVVDGTAGLAGANMTLTVSPIVIGQPVNAISWVMSQAQ